jgi:hypothetical protein
MVGYRLVFNEIWYVGVDSRVGFISIDMWQDTKFLSSLQNPLLSFIFNFVG